MQVASRARELNRQDALWGRAGSWGRGRTLGHCKDILDLDGLLQDLREDAAVTGGVCHQEEKVTMGNLLHHKHPA